MLDDRLTEFFRKDNPRGFEAILLAVDDEQSPEDMAKEVAMRVFAQGYNYGKADAGRNESREEIIF
jgi:hypothetical protein